MDHPKHFLVTIHPISLPSCFREYVDMQVLLTSTHLHLSTSNKNGQVERYNRTILAMLRNYVNENQDDWDQYVKALTYACNTSLHRSTGTTPFELVLINPLARFSIHYDIGEPRYDPNSKKSREDRIRRLEGAIIKARTKLEKTQLRYKQDFDKRIRSSNRHIQAGQYIYLDSRDGAKVHGKLGAIAESPYRVLLNDKRTFVIQRGEFVERVNPDRVTYAPPPENAPSILRFEELTTDFLSINIDGQIYLVEKLLEHNIENDGGMHFLVKWVDYPTPTRQPRSDIPEELILRYFAKVRMEQ